MAAKAKNRSFCSTSHSRCSGMGRKLHNECLCLL